MIKQSSEQKSSFENYKIQVINKLSDHSQQEQAEKDKLSRQRQGQEQIQIPEQPRNNNILDRKLPYICSLPSAKADQQQNMSIVPVSGSSILRDQPAGSDEDDHSQKH